MLTKANTEFIVEMSAEELAEKERVIERGKQTFIDVGLALKEVRDRRGYKAAGYATWEIYLDKRWHWGRTQAHYLIEAAQVVTNNVQTFEQNAPTYGQAIELGKLSGEEMKELVRETDLSKTSVRELAHKVEEIRRPHVSFNAGNNEWYTPPEYIAAARAVLGKIDLDPASSDVANKTVGAKTYYTAEDDGLAHEWRGRVWMNPPYASEWVGKFSEKMAQHFNEGKVTEALVLVNNATETNWFQTLLICSSAVCFVRQRVRFLDPDGNPGAPLQGQAVLYLGDKVKLFAEHFEQFGRILYGRA